MGSGISAGSEAYIGEQKCPVAFVVAALAAVNGHSTRQDSVR